MVGEKKIPEGYKETEIGIIPNEWNQLKLKDVATGFMSGATPYREIKRYYKGNIKWVTSGELNYNIIFDTIEKITEEARIKTNLSIIPKGTFLMAITGLEAAGTRGSCGILGIDATTNQSCMAIFSTKYLITQYLFYYYIYNGDELAFKYCQGTKQQSYTARIVKELPIIIPSSIEEQQSIATALSDIDNLILSLEKLIDKKKLIKKGAMQELLTGKKRLDGFHGEWKYIKLGNLIEYVKGYAFRSKDYKKSGIRIIRVSDTTFNYIQDDNAIYIDKKYYEDYRQWQLKEDDIIISTVGSKPPMYDSIVGKAILIDKKYSGSFLNQNSVLLRSKICNNKLIYYNLRSYKYMKHIEKIFRGNANQASINLEELFEFEIFIPNLLEEQTAIANMLSDMEAEIKKTEIKINKYKNIKRGMMEELLTGKRRLI